MAFTPFIPDTDQWTDYFMKQVSARKNNNNNGNKKRVIDTTSLIGGGVTVQDESIKLTSVGKVKQKCPSNNIKKYKNDNVKVTITSPADVTLEQAESELSNIKVAKKPSKISPSKATKRKASTKGHSASSGKKRKQAKFTDVFSE